MRKGMFVLVLLLAVLATAPARDGSALAAQFTVVQADGICNCDDDKDCDAICGEGKGTCAVTIACPDPPYKHVGTCFCKRSAFTDPDG